MLSGTGTVHPLVLSKLFRFAVFETAESCAASMIRRETIKKAGGKKVLPYATSEPRFLSRTELNL